MKRELVLTWLAVLLLPVLAAFPALSTPIEEHSYDAATFHVYRSVLFSAARAEGNLYPRWIQPINAGLGGPLFSFYSPLSYYALDALNTMGLPHPVAWRVLVVLTLWAAAVGIFLLACSLGIDAVGSLAASAVFVYSFPFLRELFERGSPEGFAVALYPWVLWSLARFVQKPDGWRFGIAALSWAVLILTHNLSALLLVPLFGMVTLVLAYRYHWRAVGAAALAFGVGVLLSAFFTLPFMVERNYVHIANAFQVDYAQIARNAFDLRDLLALPPAYDLGLDNNFIGDHLGPLAALIILGGLAASAILWRRRARWYALLVASLTLFSLLVVWLQTSSANWVWETLTFLAFVQIRTRLLGLVVLAVALVGGIVLDLLAARWRLFASYAVIAVAILLALPVLYPQLQYRYAAFARNPTPSDAAAFSMQEGVPGLTAFDEFMPIWRTVPFSAGEAQRAAQGLVASVPAGSRILRQARGNERAEVEIESPTPYSIDLLTLYFPGWVGYVDGTPHELKPVDGTGYIRMEDVPAGSHTLLLHYEGTTAQRIGAGISAITALVLLVTAIFWQRIHSALDRVPGLGNWFARIGTKPAQVNLALEDGDFNLRGLPHLPSPVWFIAGLILFFGIKSFWIDPQTTLFRQTSTCDSIQDNVAQVRVRFGGSMDLCGIGLSDRLVKPGEDIRVTLYWETTDAISEPTNSFVHLFGTTFNPKSNTPLWGQQDKETPGYHPATRWTPGKLYRDPYEFRVDPDAPPGEYQLEIGWWQPDRGQRLKPAVASPTTALTLSPIDSILVSNIMVR